MEDVLESITKESYSDEFLKELERQVAIPKKGQVYNSEYVGENEHEYLFECGFKDYIRVIKSREEFNFISELEKGDRINVGITSIINRKDFYIIGSVADVKRIEVIETLKNLSPTEFVSAHINELNSAGYAATILLDNCEIPAFMPQQLAGVNKIKAEDREKLVGQIIEVGIETFISEKGTWVISRKAFLEALIPIHIENLDFSKTYTGKVTGTAKYGVFVEFNECLTGLIHKSNLSDDIKDNFRNIEQGKEISFRVKEVQKGKRGSKIILTQEQDSKLWETIEQNQKFTGEVTSVKPFGVMVELEPNVTGIIKPNDLNPNGNKIEVSKGDSIDVSVFWVSKEERKIYLLPC